MAAAEITPTAEQEIAALEGRLRKGGDWLDAQQGAGQGETPYFRQQLDRYARMLADLAALYPRCTHPAVARIARSEGGWMVERCDVCGQDISRQQVVGAVWPEGAAPEYERQRAGGGR